MMEDLRESVQKVTGTRKGGGRITTDVALGVFTKLYREGIITPETIEDAKEEIQKVKSAYRRVSLHDLMNAVVDVLDIGVDLFLGESRQRPVVTARKIFVSLAVKEGYSAKEAGLVMGKERSNALHHLKDMDKKLNPDSPGYSRDIHSLYQFCLFRVYNEKLETRTILMRP